MKHIMWTLHSVHVSRWNPGAWLTKHPALPHVTTAHHIELPVGGRRDPPLWIHKLLSLLLDDVHWNGRIGLHWTAADVHGAVKPARTAPLDQVHLLHALLLLLSLGHAGTRHHELYVLPSLLRWELIDVVSLLRREELHHVPHHVRVTGCRHATPHHGWHVRRLGWHGVWARGDWTNVGRKRTWAGCRGRSCCLLLDGS